MICVSSQSVRMREAISGTKTPPSLKHISIRLSRRAETRIYHLRIRLVEIYTRYRRFRLAHNAQLRKSQLLRMRAVENSISRNTSQTNLCALTDSFYSRRDESNDMCSSQCACAEAISGTKTPPSFETHIMIRLRRVNQNLFIAHRFGFEPK